MNNYYDKYGRLHHKPCLNGEPSSNNGWIYTAYYFKLHNIHPNIEYTYDLIEAGEECASLLQRHPYPIESRVPISRDEILGLASLGFLEPSNINNWRFSPRPIPTFNPIKLVQQLWQCKGQHRNYFWENNLDQLYRFAFSVPLVDRDFILRHTNMETDIISHFVYWAIAKIDSLSSKKSGIRWLKYGKSLEAMQEEFPIDHPLRVVNV